jgi:hypothetical protein
MIRTTTYSTDSTNVAQKQIKEDFADIIYNLAPTKTPMLSLSKRSSTKNIETGWFIDDLSAATPHTAGDVEGDTAASIGTTFPKDAEALQVKRMMNVTQIFKKKISVSGTAESVDWFGRTSEMAYQMTKKAQEMKRDIESTICGKSQAPVGGYTGDLTGYPTAQVNTGFRTMSNFKYQIANNALGTDNIYEQGMTVGGPPATAYGSITEKSINLAMNQIWTLGGEPSIMMVTGLTANAIALLALSGSGSGLSGRYRDSQQETKLVNVVDVYVTPFGELSVVLNRFMNMGETPQGVATVSSKDNDVFLIDPEYIDVCYLRQPKTEQLSKVADSEERMIVAELTFKLLAPSSCGIITDLRIV